MSGIYAVMHQLHFSIRERNSVEAQINRRIRAGQIVIVIMPHEHA